MRYVTSVLLLTFCRRFQPAISMTQASAATPLACELSLTINKAVAVGSIT